MQVWGTDTLISQIMCASRSKVGWDIVVTRAGNMVFFDKRRESTLDMFSVDETSYDPPSNDDPESINSSVKLSLEATAINQNFAQQVVSGDKGTKKFDRPNPSLTMRRRRARCLSLLLPLPKVQAWRHGGALPHRAARLCLEKGRGQVHDHLCRQ